MSVLTIEEIRRIVTTRQSDCDGCKPSVMVWTTNGGAVTCLAVAHPPLCTTTVGTMSAYVETKALEAAA